MPSMEAGIVFIERELAPGTVIGPHSVHILRHPYAAKDLAFKPLHRIEPLPVYWPFKTRLDYLQSRYFIKMNHTDPEINGQLSLVHQMQRGLVTLKNAKDVHQTFAKAVILPEDKVCISTQSWMKLSY